jgi:uncharacterized protein (DUF4415 family)
MSRKDFSREEQEQLAELALLPDAAIDTDDIPEAPAENWIDARRGGLYRPIKQPVTLRLDADVVAWFKEHAPGGGYQSAINRVLRRHVADAEKRSR